MWDEFDGPCNDGMPMSDNDNRKFVPRDYNKMHDEIYAALCANHCTGAVADFLADLAIRVHRMEDQWNGRQG